MLRDISEVDLFILEFSRNFFFFFTISSLWHNFIFIFYLTIEKKRRKKLNERNLNT